MTFRALDDPDFVETVKKSMETLPTGTVKQLGSVLSFMAGHIGSILSTGYWSPVTAQPLAVREAILRSWPNSWFFLWPVLARSFVLMAKVAWTRTDPLFLDLNNYKPVQPEAGPDFDFKFIQIKGSTEPEVLETDVVIIGSGCGGGVCAKVLAEAGYEVLVLDKGYYHAPQELPVSQQDVGGMWEGKGAGLTTVDGSVMITAGKCWGGGGAINWSASLKTQDYVRKEWAAEGLGFFTSPEFQDCLDRVCDVMNVRDKEIPHNYANHLLLEGAQKLGWGAKQVPQNTLAGHSCGSTCHFGCRSTSKQGPAVSWLPAAARTGKARFIEGFDVSKIIFEERDGKRKATGVAGQWTSRGEHGISHADKPKVQRLVHVKAKKVILSSGALNSPLVLLRSGLQNPNIGKNLHLHPFGAMCAVFEKDVRGWEGDVVTSLVSQFEDLDGHGHGVRIESSAMTPLLSMIYLPWQGGLQFKTDALKFRHMVAYMSIARDRDTGRVVPGPDDGEAAIAYTTSSFDCRSIVKGIVGAAKICYIQGALELHPVVPGVSRFQCTRPPAQRSMVDPDFVDWIAGLERADLKPSASIINSGHQMGTCRMSSDEKKGVVDESGKVFRTENLYIADTSVFPSASGDNPMITVMAIADHVARGIAASMI
ncbi:long-chain fatty alcohol dehydrogenase [Hypoxylon sp. NC1633]|nr:long-chain fatty alcohol dehydrogenase [Hypoxylon sp. NC1633]